MLDGAKEFPCGLGIQGFLYDTDVDRDDERSWTPRELSNIMGAIAEREEIDRWCEIVIGLDGRRGELGVNGGSERPCLKLVELNKPREYVCSRREDDSPRPPHDSTRNGGS